MTWWRRGGTDRARFILDAEYFQFYLEDAEAYRRDAQAVQDASRNWTEQAVTELLFLAPGTIGVGTVKDGEVRVELAVVEAEPRVDHDHWDQIVDCSIAVPSGRLLVFGCLEEPRTVKVVAGPYRARIHYGGLNVMEPDEGDDHYLVYLWTSPAAPPHFLKRLRWGSPP